TVTVNKDKVALTNAEVIDILPEGTTYETGSLEIYKLKTALSGKVLDQTDVTSSVTESYDHLSRKLTVHLGNINHAYKIKYTTKITNNKKKTFKNDAAFIDDNHSDVEAKTKVIVE